MTYRTRRILQRLGIIALIVILIGILASFCWVIWLERYVVYADGGATLNFDLPDPGPGQIASPPNRDETVPIYYNEGENTLQDFSVLTRVNGYYIDADTLVNDLEGARAAIATLDPGTAVMIELKNAKGYFYYSSNLVDAVHATHIDITAVDSLIADITSRGLYAIAKIPAFVDWNFGLNHVSSGLPLPQGYLWVDERGNYWLNPINSGTQNWLFQIIQELKSLGFSEVVLSDFRMPTSERIVFNGDREEAVIKAAQTLATNCAVTSMAVSFIVTDPAFKLPEGRCRMYMENVGAKEVPSVISKVTVPDPIVNLVFIANTNDTRYNEYSILRPIATAGENRE